MWRALAISLSSLLVGCAQYDSDRSATSGPTREQRPNILLIVADDLGYSDVGAFGSEIPTPTLDGLASQGMILTNFHVSMTCSPTRAMLMTGADNHEVGLGNMAELMAENQRGQPGYEGYLNERVQPLAERLTATGYHTYVSGKWHLGTAREHAPKNRGFEQSFGPIYGGGDHFRDRFGPDEARQDLLYRENGNLLRELPKDFYSTTFYTDRVIQQIDSNLGDGRPFFAYLSYTAPHWPLQAPDRYLGKFRGAYDQGYDAVRDARVRAQVRLGLLENRAKAAPRPDHVTPWSELTADDRLYHSRRMEIYAAMVSYMDASIQRVLDYLSANGLRENTVVVFMSDNGAEAWSEDFGPPGWAVRDFAAKFDNTLDNAGRAGSFVFYGPEWAHVSNTPFRGFKGSLEEGGIRVPAIVSWPGHVAPGSRSDALTFVRDWYTTFAEIAGLEDRDGGHSLVPLLRQIVDEVRDFNDPIGLELLGMRSILQGDWKGTLSPQPFGDGAWKLYHLPSDPAETINLADTEADQLQLLLQSWANYEQENNVILPEGPLTISDPDIPAE